MMDAALIVAGLLLAAVALAALVGIVWLTKQLFA